MNQATAIQNNHLGAAGIAGTDRIGVREIAFIALRVAGYSGRAAYHAIKPEVTDGTAETQGKLWTGRLRNIIDRTTLDQALSAFGDLVPFAIATSEGHPERLAAAKELSKLAGRYERAATVSDLAALMGALGTPNQAPIKPKSTDDEYVETLAETVDLTRPEPDAGT